MELGLDGKVAIVTGGSEGIGKAAALRMAGEGANVIIVARRQDVLDAAADEIRTATEGEVLPLSADVTGRNTAAQVVNTAVERYGRVDILVNNAGASMAKGFEDVSDDDWEFDFELKGVGRRPPDPGVHPRNAQGWRWPHHQRNQSRRTHARAPTRCPRPSHGPPALPSPRACPRTWHPTTSWSTPFASASSRAASTSAATMGGSSTNRT